MVAWTRTPFRAVPRDTRAWYRDADPMEQVDYALVDFVAAARGPQRARPGLRPRRVQQGARRARLRGSRPSTWSPSTSSAPASWACAAELYDGERLPLADGTVDTAILLEVIEHLEDPSRLLAEARRVARDGVLVTTPNCTQSFGRVPIEFSHMLDVDHRQFFTEASLTALLDEVFGSCEVEQVAPIDRNLAGLVLPRPLRPLYRALDRLGRAKPRYFTRLRASGARPVTRVLFISAEPLGRVDGRSGDPRARAGAGGRGALRGDRGGARPERRRRRPDPVARGAAGRLRQAARGGQDATTWWWPSGCRPSCCATSRSCRCASSPTSTTRR